MEQRIVSIAIEKALVGTDWLVMLDSYPVTFRTEFEATAFLDTLRDRINAPHELPAR
jgi:hypothetical protein